MAKDYFKRINRLTPTRLWINNPTTEEARKSIEAGAVSCTTNPTFCMKILQKDESERDKVISIIDEVIKETQDDNHAADVVQQRMTKEILDIFLPLYKKNPGNQGFVSIQGDPNMDTDTDHIIDEALRYRELGDNFITKIPVTNAGLVALEALIPEDMAMIATEIMGISQALATCEMYKKVSDACGKYPPLYLTHITGIFDEYLAQVVEDEGIDISSDALWQAGIIIARKQYRIFKKRNYPGIMLGGGARGLHHFTEMVGSEMHVTINWTGAADRLIKENPPVEYHIFSPASGKVVDELLDKIEVFRKAYAEDGLTVDEFAGFGPVAHFRGQFIEGWKYLLDTIGDRRDINSQKQE